MGDEEVALGGLLTGAVRVGDTVRRATGPWTPAVHALLHHLERGRFDGAPRVLGIDEQNREILTWIEGEVAWGPRHHALLGGDAALARAAGLLRRYHDAVASFVAPPGAVWRFPDMAADSRPYSTGADIVCHNDPAGWNLVVGPERWALIDWDVAGPRPAIWDVAYLVRGMVPLTDDEGASLGWPTPPDVLHRLDVIAGGYGLSPTDRDRLPAVVVARIESSYRAMERRAAAGEQPWSDLFAGGHGRTWKAVLDLARRVLL